jgi:hypothetical protein
MHRERSAQEAAFLLAGLRLKACSRTTIFVNSKYPINRARMVKKECVGKTFYDEEDYTENIFHRYQKRPLVLENLCLAEYVTEYEVCKFKDDTIDSDIDSDKDDLLNEEEIKIINGRQILKQLNSEIYIRRRLKSAVLKTPYLSVADDALNIITVYWYCIFLLETNL